jgi:multidrug efflux system membrane fusion protein
MFFSNPRHSLTLILFTWLASCATAPAPKPIAEAPPVRVSAIKVHTTDWPDGFESTGTVRARTSTSISSRVMGYVRQVYVNSGDRVRSGQSLATIDSRELDAAHKQAQAAVNEARSGQPEAEAAVSSARAQLDLAQTTLRRMKDLLDKRSVSQQEYDEAVARASMAESGLAMAQARQKQLSEKIRQAEQGLEQAAVMRSYTDIAAPFAGLVTARRVEPGVLAAPGMPLLEIEQAGLYRLEAAVEESRLNAVKAGAKVTVTLEAVESPLEGRVAEIVPAVDPASRAFTVKIDLPGHSSLRSGLFGRAAFQTGRRPVLAIPKTAVRAQGQVLSVMVARDGYARSRMVTTGRSLDGGVEVLSGLQEGEMIIPQPGTVADGARIEVTAQ